MQPRSLLGLCLGVSDERLGSRDGAGVLVVAARSRASKEEDRVPHPASCATGTMGCRWKKSVTREATCNVHSKRCAGSMNSDRIRIDFAPVELTTRDATGGEAVANNTAQPTNKVHSRHDVFL